MMRLILMLAFVALLAFAAMAMLGMVQTVIRTAVGKDEDIMPNTFKKVAFGALVILLLGLSTGLLGGL
ncbi:hypothetical protein [Yoonia sp. BS5-3]|uniref:Uncharacterized protein n=1 Tax=Yoonia phaeophyticola TaxID=3137369 RepID=A0ABZ2VBY3_9RHOB